MSTWSMFSSMRYFGLSILLHSSCIFAIKRVTNRLTEYVTISNRDDLQSVTPRVAICFNGHINGRVSQEVTQSIREFFISPLMGLYSSPVVDNRKTRSDNIRPPYSLDILINTPIRDRNDLETQARAVEFATNIIPRNINQSHSVKILTIDETDLLSTLSEDGLDFEKQSGLLIHFGQAFCGSRYWVYRSLQMCIQEVEKGEAGGLVYDWVIRTRPDMMWTTPHFPLEYLDEQGLRTYTSDGEDYGGLSDRHSVMTREAAGIYMYQYHAIRSGKALQIMDDYMSRVSIERLNPEVYTALLLIYQNVTVDRMPNGAYVYCEPNSPTGINYERSIVTENFWDVCDSRNMVEWIGNYPCRISDNPELKNVKYEEEYLYSQSVANCLGGRDWDEESIEQCWCGLRKVDSMYFGANTLQLCK